MKGHPHAKLAQQFWAEMEEDDQAYKNWERKLHGGSGQWIAMKQYPIFYSRDDYRRKLKTHIVNGFEVPAPETKPVGLGKGYWAADPSNVNWTGSGSYWEGDRHDECWLQRGLIHLTKEAAIANAKAMCGIDPEAEA